jgi:hypothetical protein
MKTTKLKFSQDWQYLSTRQGATLPLSFLDDEEAMVEMASVLIGPGSEFRSELPEISDHSGNKTADSVYPTDVQYGDWSDWSAQHLRLQRPPSSDSVTSDPDRGTTKSSSAPRPTTAASNSKANEVRALNYYDFSELQWGSDSSFGSSTTSSCTLSSSSSSSSKTLSEHEDEPVRVVTAPLKPKGFTELVFEIQTPQAAQFKSHGDGAAKRRRKSK